MLGEIQLIEITFELPEWVGDERFEKETPIYYGLGHAYEGQFKGYRHENEMLDGLHAIKGAKEVCMNMQTWITAEFGCNISILTEQVALFQENLRAFLQDERWMK